MNKCIRQNWRLFNKITFRPIGLEMPKDLEHPDKWAEVMWKYLIDSDELTRKAYHCKKGKQGYTISVWQDESCVYLIQVIRSEWNTDETTIFATINTEDNLNDFLHIAKFIHKNINKFIGESITNVNEFNKWATIQEEMNRKADGEA